MSDMPVVTLQGAGFSSENPADVVSAALAAGTNSFRIRGPLEISGATASASVGRIRYSSGNRLQYSNGDSSSSSWHDLVEGERYAWVGGRTYAAGSFVLYQGGLYSAVKETANVPGANRDWKLLTIGRDIWTVSTSDQFKAALEQPADTVRIYLDGVIATAVSAEVTASNVIIWSDESAVIAASVTLSPADSSSSSAAAAQRVWWHARGTRLAGGGLTITSNILWTWIEHFSFNPGAASAVITFGGNIVYSRVDNGTVTAAAGAHVEKRQWTGPAPDAYVPRDMSSVASAAYNPADTVFVSGTASSGKLPLGTITAQAKAEAATAFSVQRSGPKSNRPDAGSLTVGSNYFATDASEGNLYFVLGGATNTWSDGVHIVGPAGTDGTNGTNGAKGDAGANGVTYIPSVDQATGKLTWTKEEGDPLVNPGDADIRGPNGYTAVPSIDAMGILSWTVDAIGGTPTVPVARRVVGVDGLTAVPRISSGGDLTWTLQVLEDSSSSVLPRVFNIKGEPGADGEDGEDGANGITYIPSVNQATGLLTWTASTVTPGEVPAPAVISGPNGLTFVPDITGGTISWAATTSTSVNPPAPTNIMGPAGESAFEAWKRERGTETSTYADFLDAMGTGSRVMTFTAADVSDSTVIFSSVYSPICIVTPSGGNTPIPSGKVSYGNGYAAVSLDWLMEELDLHARPAMFTLGNGVRYKRLAAGDIAGYYAWTTDDKYSHGILYSDVEVIQPGSTVLRPSPTSTETLFAATYSDARSAGSLTGTWGCYFSGGGARDGQAGGTFPDAPADGNVYSRKDNAWVITGGTFTQAQSDWTATDTTQPDYIRHKPSIPDGMLNTVAVSASTVTVSPSVTEATVVTANAEVVVNVTSVPASKVAYSEVTFVLGESGYVTPGLGLSLAQIPEAGKTSVCIIRWYLGAAKLYVAMSN